MPWRLGERLTLADEYRDKIPLSEVSEENDERSHWLLPVCASGRAGPWLADFLVCRSPGALIP